MNRKLLLIFLIAFVIVIGGVFGFIAYQKHQYTKSMNKIEQSTDEKMNSSVGKKNYKKEKSTDNKVNVISYVPVLKDKSENKQLCKTIKNEAKETIKKLGNNEKAVILYTFSKNKTAKNADSYNFYQQIYQKEKNKLIAKDNQRKPIGNNIVIDDETGKQLELGDVVKHETDALDELRQSMQNSVIALKKIPMKKISVLADAKYPTDLKSTNFSLTEKDLIVPIEIPNYPDIVEVKVPLKRFADNINPKFLPKDITITEKPALKPGKKIALTFDDGPNAKTTPGILATLKKYNVKATFFVLGSSVLANPGIVEKELKAGHQVGNHSFNHPQLTKLSKEEVAGQILRTQMAVYNQTGYFPELVRPPYGAVHKNTAAVIDRPIAQWSVDTMDWKVKSPGPITNAVINRAYDGAIVLMHDTHSFTAKSLDATLKKLKAQGYQFVTVNEILQSKPKIGHQYFDQNDERIVK